MVDGAWYLPIEGNTDYASVYSTPGNAGPTNLVLVAPGVGSTPARQINEFLTATSWDGCATLCRAEQRCMVATVSVCTVV